MDEDGGAWSGIVSLDHDVLVHGIEAIWVDVAEDSRVSHGGRQHRVVDFLLDEEVALDHGAETRVGDLGYGFRRRWD